MKNRFLTRGVARSVFSGGSGVNGFAAFRCAYGEVTGVKSKERRAEGRTRQSTTDYGQQDNQTTRQTEQLLKQAREDVGDEVDHEMAGHVGYEIAPPKIEERKHGTEH
jgi:hypothetical protein